MEGRSKLTVKVGLGTDELVADSATEEEASPPSASSISSARALPTRHAVEQRAEATRVLKRIFSAVRRSWKGEKVTNNTKEGPKESPVLLD